MHSAEQRSSNKNIYKTTKNSTTYRDFHKSLFFHIGRNTVEHALYSRLIPELMQGGEVLGCFLRKTSKNNQAQSLHKKGQEIKKIPEGQPIFFPAKDNLDHQVTSCANELLKAK